MGSPDLGALQRIRLTPEQEDLKGAHGNPVRVSNNNSDNNSSTNSNADNSNYSNNNIVVRKEYMCVYIYIYMYVCVCIQIMYVMCIYIYIILISCLLACLLAIFVGPLVTRGPKAYPPVARGGLSARPLFGEERSVPPSASVNSPEAHPS